MPRTERDMHQLTEHCLALPIAAPHIHDLLRLTLQSLLRVGVCRLLRLRTHHMQAVSWAHYQGPRRERGPLVRALSHRVFPRAMRQSMLVPSGRKRAGTVHRVLECADPAFPLHLGRTARQQQQLLMGVCRGLRQSVRGWSRQV